MDLSSLDTRKAAGDGAKYQLRHPVEDTPITTDDGKPVTITVIGTDSEAFRRAAQAQANSRLKHGQRSRVTAETVESDATDLLVACTTGWSGIVVDGKELDFSAENARALYDRFPWIREQVSAFAAERANFLKA